MKRLTKLSGITVLDARRFIDTNSFEGAECPVCKRLVKRYSRLMYSTQAYDLIKLYKLCKHNPGFYHIRKFANPGGDFSKLRYWGLVEEMPKDMNVKYKRTSGYWTITKFGSLFVRGEVRVQSRLILELGKLIGFDGDKVFIDQVLGENYDYEKIMKSIK